MEYSQAPNVAIQYGAFHNVDGGDTLPIAVRINKFSAPRDPLGVYDNCE